MSAPCDVVRDQRLMSGSDRSERTDCARLATVGTLRDKASRANRARRPPTLLPKNQKSLAAHPVKHRHACTAQPDIKHRREIAPEHNNSRQREQV